MRPSRRALTLALLFAALATGQQEKLPHFDARQHRTEYVGPQQTSVDPADIHEVRIGYFGPSDPDHPLTGTMWEAAQAAINEANAEGGYHGKPFRLVPAWSNDPWGTGVTQVTRLVYRDRVWAIVGGIDGPTTHLAEQVVAKARLALVSPISTDKSVNLANVPWMFSLAPDDHRIASVLAPHIAASARQGDFVVIASNDHDSFLLTRELRKVLDRLRVIPHRQFEFRSAAGQWEEMVEETLAVDPAAVVIIAGAEDSLRLVRRFRDQQYHHRIYGGPGMARQLFRQQIGADAGALCFPLLAHADPAAAAKVEHRAEAQPAAQHPGVNWLDSDYAAVQTYDAVRMTIAAIHRAGLNRPAIAQALRELAPWPGRSGTVSWNGLGSNMRAVLLATLHDGRVVPLPSDQLATSPD